MTGKIPDSYFHGLNAILKGHQRAIPCLLIDLDKLDQNMERLRTDLRPDARLRIVVKSLPSFELIDYVMQKTQSRDLMVFHQPFLTELCARLDDQADILLGKPMPIRTAQYFYEHLPAQGHGFDPYRQIQWLADTEARILQYIGLAEKLGRSLRLNLELDVGLHRGGFGDTEQLRKALALIKEHEDQVEFSGFMGYDPQVAKIPALIRSRKRSLQLSNGFYHRCRALLRDEFPGLWHERLTFNGAGSPTFRLHKTATSPLNDIALGSCLVMPTTFDMSSLAAYEAACFIAAPVLKTFEGTKLPGLEGLKKLLNLMNKRNRQSLFIYGGYWKADYCYPAGLRQNALFGPSTNQTMLNAPPSAKLAVDDFVFLRPHQSESVFLQFGELLMIRGDAVVDRWALLKNC